MKYYLIFFMLLFGSKAFPQNFFMSFFGGTSNYQGDLEQKLYSLRQTHPAWGIGLLFELNENIMIRGDLVYGKISGNDADGGKYRSRNLNFTSNITEFAVGLEYIPLNLYDYKVSPYFFTEIAVFRFSPHAKDINGNLFSLWELSTEGQGFYDNRKKYKLTQFSIPFGGGVQWGISYNTRVAVVFGFRKTFTDYLDDVSKTYVDQDLLTQKRGGLATAYAYRGDELNNGAPYPAADTKRGTSPKRDWYYLTGLSLRVRILSHKKKNDTIYKIKKSRVTCPRPF